jgi:hypothetical protein
LQKRRWFPVADGRLAEVQLGGNAALRAALPEE